MSLLSIQFYIFLFVVFSLYWLCVKYRTSWRNGILLLAGYVFYAWQDWHYLPLLLWVSCLCYGYGICFPWLKRRGKDSFCLWGLLILLLGILIYFKYASFLWSIVTPKEDSLCQKESGALSVLLPLGISFYLFSSIGYVVDVYKGRISPETNLVDFCVFVGFFPIVSSGPIERSTTLLPQLKRKPRFDYDLAVAGCRQILLGLFMKMVVADNCADSANRLLNSDSVSGLGLWVGMVLYTFQIYGDFSGYSNVAIGCAKLLGIHLSQNFKYPYFSQNTVEFWQNWHVTLNTWFRDYLYIPLGGSRVSYWHYVFNCILVFGLSGLWHGANWTFVCWGLYNALLIILYRSFAKKQRAEMEMTGYALRCWGRRLVHFVLVVLGWTFFRASSMRECWGWLRKMFSFSQCLLYQRQGFVNILPRVLPWIALLGVVETIAFCKRKEVFDLVPKNIFSRWSIYFFGLLLIFFFAGKSQSFIYFNF